MGYAETRHIRADDILNGHVPHKPITAHLYGKDLLSIAPQANQFLAGLCAKAYRSQDVFIVYDPRMRTENMPHSNLESKGFHIVYTTRQEIMHYLRINGVEKKRQTR